LVDRVAAGQGEGGKDEWEGEAKLHGLWDAVARRKLR